MPYLVKAVAGPDRVVPNKQVVGFDGTRSTPQGLGGADEIEYWWEMIQAPEGDPYLKHFTNAYVEPYTERVMVPGTAPAQLYTTAGSSEISVFDSNGVPVPVDLAAAGVQVGDVLIITAGANAGRYVVVDDPSGAFLNELKLDRPLGWTGLTAYPGFKFYAADSLLVSLTFAAGEIVVGDTLLVDGIPVHIALTGVNQVTLSVFTPLPLVGLTFPHVVVIGGAILRNPLTAFPSFVPSVQGLYTLRMRVKTVSMATYVDPDVLAVSVLPSTSALSLPVDASWIWKALSDFWSNVSDKTWMEGMWRTVLRTYGAMLQELWNVELSASLANAQDVSMSRWLPIEPRLVEPEPEKVGFFQRFRKIYSDAFLGWPVNIFVIVYKESTPFSFSYSGLPSGFAAALDAAMVAEGIEGVSANVETLTTTMWGVQYHLVVKSSTYYIQVGGGIFSSGPLNNVFGGTGLVIDDHTFAFSPAIAQPGSYSMSCYDYDGVIKAGDPINIGGTNHTVTAVGVSREQEYPYTRVMVKETINRPVGDTPVYCAPSFFKSPTVDYRWEMVTPGDKALLTVLDNGVRSDLSTPVHAASAYCLGIDHPALYFANRETLLEGVLRLFYVPVDDIWMSVPQLKAAPDDAVGWLEYAEHVVVTRWERRCVMFDFLNEKPDDYYASLIRTLPTVTPPSGDPYTPYPPDRLWAEVVYLDQRPDLSERFGKGMSFPLEKSPTRPGYSYQRALLGLWYCYLHGSKPRMMERGLSIILGAPFFESDGVIIGIQKLDPERGYLLVSDKEDPEIVRGYIYRLSLGLDLNPLTGEVYRIGDEVKQFETVTNSAVYRDYINDPDFIRAMIVAGIITEPEKIHHFFIGVDVDALDPSDTQSLQAAADFLELFRTTYNEPYFTLIKRLEETLEIEEYMSVKTTLMIDSYFGARWGFPRLDRAQLSGIQQNWHTGMGVGSPPSTDKGFHNKFGVTIYNQEHYTAVIVAGGGGATREIEIRHVQKDGTHGSAINPRLYGIKPGDQFVEPMQPPDIVAWVDDNRIGLVNPYWGPIWPTAGSDLFEWAIFGRNVWCGVDDSKFQPRSYVRIRLLDALGNVVESEKVLPAANPPARAVFTDHSDTIVFEDQLGNPIDLVLAGIVVGDVIDIYGPATNAGTYIIKLIPGLATAFVEKQAVATENVDYPGYKIFARSDYVVVDYPGPELDATNPHWPEDWPWTPWP